MIGGRAVEDELPGRKGRLAFAYLVANRDRPVGRDELIGALWPEEGAEFAPQADQQHASVLVASCAALRFLRPTGLRIRL